MCILLYADDIVLISESEQNLQIMLDFVNSWCYKLQMKIVVEHIIQKETICIENQKLFPQILILGI